MDLTPEQETVFANHRKVAERNFENVSNQLVHAKELGTAARRQHFDSSANPFVGDLDSKVLFDAWAAGWSEQDARA